MRVLIIEDEKDVSDLLVRFLKKIDKTIEVLDVLRSIETAVSWLNSKPEPDLIFMDVKLPDGNSFDIFERVIIDTPIIFTTGYDEYALQAFRLNSIDYLVKPLNPNDLRNAIEKYKRITTFAASENNPDKAEYKSRFLVKTGKKYQSVHYSDIAYFCVENKLCFIYTNKGERFILDNTLDEVAKSVNPKSFYRINRQFLVRFSSIETMENYFNNRLLLHLKPKPRETAQVLVSSKKIAEFKTWLDR